MPGYDSQVIMAAGAFVQGSSIELSADGPIKPPYAVYFQGGLTWYHAKLGIMMALQKLVDAGIVSTDFTGAKCYRLVKVLHKILRELQKNFLFFRYTAKKKYAMISTAA